MSQAKREKRFLEAVRRSGLVSEAELEKALSFQTFAHARGKALPLDRIMLKFSLLDEAQIEGIYLTLRYYSWRKEDKFYAKIAVQSRIVSPENAKACLKEQKRLFKEKGQLRRFNDIARERDLLGQKEDKAIFLALKKVKPGTALVPLGDSPASKKTGSSSHGPAKSGEEERWKKDMRARELAELSNAARDEKVPDGLDDPPPGVDAPPVSQLTSDDDLDPLWDEADLDEIELDSGDAEAKRPLAAGSPGDDDETDLLDD